MFQFVLGPIDREYSPESVLAPGLAPTPLTSHIMGPRFYVATEAISQVPNLFQPEDWPKRSSGKMANWVSAPARGINHKPIEFEYIRRA